MRRFWMILVAMLAALSLLLSASCKKEHLKKDAEEGEPGGPGQPPTPGIR